MIVTVVAPVVLALLIEVKAVLAEKFPDSPAAPLTLAFINLVAPAAVVNANELEPATFNTVNPAKLTAPKVELAPVVVTFNVVSTPVSIKVPAVWPFTLNAKATLVGAVNPPLLRITLPVPPDRFKFVSALSLIVNVEKPLTVALVIVPALVVLLMFTSEMVTVLVATPATVAEVWPASVFPW